MGPSGSGKTTLLNVLSSIDQISSGSVIANGQELNKLNQKALAKFRKESLGFIFQDYSILPTLTVKKTLCYLYLFKNVEGNNGRKLQSDHDSIRYL